VNSKLTSTEKPSVSWKLVTSLLLGSVAIALRIVFSRTEIGFDEIFSYNLVTPTDISAVSFSTIFTGIHSDNNHHLNSLYLYWLGDNSSFLIFRLHSLVAGAGSLALAYLIGQRSRYSCGPLTMFMVGFSYIILVYSTEARGYSLMMLFALFCIYSYERSSTSKSIGWGLALSVSASLGLLAHATFLFLLGGLVLQVLSTFVPYKPGRLRQLSKWSIVYFTMPSLTCIGMYLIDYRKLMIAGGPTISTLDTVVRSFSYLVGGSPNHPWSVGFAIIGLLAVLCGIVLLRRSDRQNFVLYVSTIFVLPIFALAVAQPAFIYIRYFLIPILFATILLSFLLSNMLSRTVHLRRIAAAFLLLFVGGNAVQIQHFLRAERGSHRSALEFILENSGVDTVYVSSSKDFTTLQIMAFYSNHVADSHRLQYLALTDISEAQMPDWFILERAAFSPPLAGNRVKLTTKTKTHSYIRSEEFLASEPSGLSWYLFKKP